MAQAGAAQGAAKGNEAVMTLGQAYMQSQALKSQGEYQRKISELNARSMELQAQDVLTRGEYAASKTQQAGRKAIGTQRAIMAATGMDVSSAEAKDLLAESEAGVATDIATIKSNAWRQAWGFQSGAEQELTQGRITEYTKKNLARSTMLTGIMKSANLGMQAAASGAGG